MIVLSMFISTKLSSVYSVYALVFTQLSGLLSSVYTNFHYVLGRTYHNDIEQYKKTHDLFSSLCLGTMSTFMAVSYILILPFVHLYTNGVNDVNYIYHELPIMFCMIQMLSWSRMVTGHLTGVAGYAKKVSVVSLIEAFTNVVFSVVLVRSMGIIGVLLATVLALPLKVIYCTYLCDRKILHRSYVNTLKIYSANYLVFASAVLVHKIHEFHISGYLSFMLYALGLSIFFGILTVAANYVANPSVRYFLQRRLKHG